MKLLPDEAALHLIVNFRLANESPPTTNEHASVAPSQLLIKRNHQQHQLMTELQLRSQTALPCSLLTGLLPQLERLGTAASFSGVIDLQMQDNAWGVQLSDVNVRQIDFGKLSQQTPAAVSGSGEIFVNRAVLNHDRLEFVEGSVLLGPGRISSPLLQGIARHLDVELRAANPVNLHAFDAAAFSIRIQPERLQLAGRLADDALISDGVGSLAVRAEQAWERWIPLANLVEVLNDVELAGTSLDGVVVDGLPQRANSLSRSAMIWLPLDSKPERTAGNLRLSQTR